MVYIFKQWFLYIVILVRPAFSLVSVRPGVHFYPSAYPAPSWQAGEEDCEIIGGTLAKIATRAEHDSLIAFMSAWGYGEVYVGGSDAAVEGNWIWRDGTSVNRYIAPSYFNPDNYNGVEDSLVIVYNGHWGDVADTDLRYFVCEVKPESAAAQAAYDTRVLWVVNGLFTPAPGAIEMEGVGKQYFYPHSRHVIKTWQEARQVCQAAGGNADLATVTTENEYNMTIRFRKIYEQQYDNIWIGGQRAVGSTDWRWLDEASAFTWPTYVTTFTPDTAVAACLTIATSDLWAEVDCNVARRFLCQRDRAGQRSWHGVCYWINTNLKTVPQATVECGNSDGQMGKINNAMEYMAVSPALAQQPEVYLGLQVGSESWTYKWNDDSILTWSKWYPNQPSSTAELCVHTLAYIATWNDVSCGVPKRFLCEKDVSAQPTDVDNLRKELYINEVIYRPVSGYLFTDGTTVKNYACDSTVDYNMFINSLAVTPHYTIREATYENYDTSNTNIVFDGNPQNCHNLVTPWTYMPVTTFQVPHSGPAAFSVALTVTDDFTDAAKTNIRVYTRTDSSSGATNYRAVKCDRPDSALLSYDCQCDADCVVGVRVSFKSMDIAARYITAGLCTITMT